MDSTTKGRPCVYTVTGWGAMSCVCGMVFLCGSTLVKVPLLQAGSVVIWPQMFKSDVKRKRTNIIFNILDHTLMLPMWSRQSNDCFFDTDKKKRANNNGLVRLNQLCPQRSLRSHRSFACYNRTMGNTGLFTTEWSKISTYDHIALIFWRSNFPCL